MCTRARGFCTSDLGCECGRGISFEKVEAAERITRAEARATERIVGAVCTNKRHLEAVESLARMYVEERKYVQIQCCQRKLEAHYNLLRGAYRSPPGVVRRNLIDALPVYTRTGSPSSPAHTTVAAT